QPARTSNIKHLHHQRGVAGRCLTRTTLPWIKCFLRVSRMVAAPATLRQTRRAPPPTRPSIAETATLALRQCAIAWASRRVSRIARLMPWPRASLQQVRRARWNSGSRPTGKRRPARAQYRAYRVRTVRPCHRRSCAQPQRSGLAARASGLFHAVEELGAQLPTRRAAFECQPFVDGDHCDRLEAVRGRPLAARAASVP